MQDFNALNPSLSLVSALSDINSISNAFSNGKRQFENLQKNNLVVGSVTAGIKASTKTYIKEKTGISGLESRFFTTPVGNAVSSISDRGYSAYSSSVQDFSRNLTFRRAFDQVSTASANHGDIVQASQDANRMVLNSRIPDGSVGSKLASKLAPDVVGNCLPVASKALGSAVAGVGLSTAIGLAINDRQTKANQLSIGSGVAIGVVASVIAISIPITGSILGTIAVAGVLGAVNYGIVHKFPVVKHLEQDLGEVVIKVGAPVVN